MILYQHKSIFLTKNKYLKTENLHILSLIQIFLVSSRTPPILLADISLSLIYRISARQLIRNKKCEFREHSLSTTD